MDEPQEPLYEPLEGYVMQRFRVYWTPHFQGVPGLADSPECQFPEPHATRMLVATFKHRENAQRYVDSHRSLSLEDAGGQVEPFTPEEEAEVRVWIAEALASTELRGAFRAVTAARLLATLDAARRGSLDAAWAEAVAAAKAKDRDLSLQGLQAYDQDWWIATAEARTADVCPTCGRPGEPAVSKADAATPVAALRAVIAALRAEA